MTLNNTQKNKEIIHSKISRFFNLLGQYELLLDNINIQTWYIIKPDIYGVVNQAHANFLGKNKEDLAYKSIKGILTDECIEKNREVFKSKKSLITEEEYKDYLGNKRILKINRIPQLDESGKVAFVMCTGEDITDFVETKYNKTFLSKIVEKCHDAIIITNNRFKITYINKAGQKLFGYKFKEIEGHLISELILDEYENQILPYIKDVTSKGSEFVGDYVNVKKDGSLFNCSYKVQTLHEGSKGLRYIFYHRDITSNIKIRKEFENMCNKFHTIYREAPFAIITHDAQTGEITDANKKALESYKVKTLEELKETDIWCNPPYSFNDAVKVIRKTSADQPQKVEWICKDKYGNLFCKIVNLKIIQIDGIDRVLAMSVNIDC